MLEMLKKRRDAEKKTVQSIKLVDRKANSMAMAVSVLESSKSIRANVE